jgi:hypothetical protein
MTLEGISVVDRQNSPRGIKLLRARSSTYRRAARMQKVQLWLAVLAPFVGSVLGILISGVRPYVAAVSLVITLLDVALIDRLQRNQLKLAARICEVFDTEVLQLPWSNHAAGAPPTPEQIDEAADSWRSGETELRDWYPVAVARAPIHLARVICQRTNLWYDSELRRRYSGILLSVVIGALVILFAGGLVAKINLVDFVATVLTPAAPMLLWALRDFYRQRDTADAQAAARAELEQLWKLVVSKQCEADECLSRARELQNTIFTRRSTSPLIFPGLYSRLRPGLEGQMNVGAEELLAQAGIHAAV